MVSPRLCRGGARESVQEVKAADYVTSEIVSKKLAPRMTQSRNRHAFTAYKVSPWSDLKGMKT